MAYDKTAPREVVEKTIEALKANGINAIFVQTGEEARKKVTELVPTKSEVMTYTSVTTDTLNISDDLNDSAQYNAVRDKLYAGDTLSKGEKNKLGAAPEYAVGSVHAVTQDGQVIIASNTGSQLPAYAYGAQNVVWVVGTHKIVEDLDDGMKRVYDYVLPLESERARKAYGVAGSFVSKLLIINREVNPERLTLIFVDEVLGY